MAKFTISIAGSDYEIEGPAGATEAQAREILTKQIDTGGLVGFKVGDFLNVAKQAEGGLAGAIAQLGSRLTEEVNKLSTQLPNLTNVNLQNPIDVANYANLKLPSQINIGTLVPSQVQGLMAQTANFVNQPAAAISNTLGLGKFGFDASQLEKYGLLKPGTSELITKGIGSFTDVLGSPASWTGKLGADSLTSVLGNDTLQNTIQQGLMSSGFNQLGSIGAITNNLAADKLGPLVNNAAKFGADAVAKWTSGLTSQLPAGLVGQLDLLGKSSIFAGGFAALGPIAGLFGGGGSPLVTAIKQAKGFLNTVNRSTVNFAFSNLIKNPKIPKPSFTIPTPLTSAQLQQLNQRLRTLETKRTAFSVGISTSVFGAVSPSDSAINAAITQAQTLLAEAKTFYATVSTNPAAATLIAAVETIIGYYQAIIDALGNLLTQ
jgi:hypothetical protein